MAAQYELARVWLQDQKSYQDSLPADLARDREAIFEADFDERAKENGGLVLLLSERDLRVFLRQSKKGKVSEDHIRDRYDETVRMIS